MNMLPIYTLVFGLVAGYSYMSNIAIERQAIMDEDSLTLAKQSYRRGCVDKGGKFKECEKEQGYKDLEELFKKVENALEKDQVKNNIIPLRNNQLSMEIRDFKEIQKKSIKI